MATGGVVTCVEMLKHLEDYLQQDGSLKILIAGKMGVGKSSLVNSIYGAELAEEGTSAAAVTEKIYCFTANIPTPYESRKSKDSTITVWDSPGFGDIFAKKRENKMDLELVTIISEVHILLYCFDIRQRLSNDDAQGLIKITKRAHPDIWRNAVFVLTFCNKLEPPPNKKVDPVCFFTETFHSWHKQITRALRELAGVPDEIVRGISVVVSGYRDKQPPGYSNWYTSFWSSIFVKTRDDGQPLLLKLTCNRMVDNGPGSSSTPDLSALEPPSPDTLGTNPYALIVNLFGDRDQPGSVTNPAPAQGFLDHPEKPQPKQPQPEQPRPEQPRPEQPRPEQPRPEQPRPEQPQPEREAEQPQPEQQDRSIARELVVTGSAAGAGAVVGGLIGAFGGGVGAGIGAAGGAVVGGVIGLIAIQVYNEQEKKGAG